MSEAVGFLIGIVNVGDEDKVSITTEPNNAKCITFGSDHARFLAQQLIDSANYIDHIVETKQHSKK